MRSRLTTTILATALLASACGGSSSDTASPTPDTEISLVEYAIGIDGGFDDGPTVVRVFNIGHAHHNLSICPTEDDGASCSGPPVEHDMLKRPEEARDPSFFDDRGDSLTIGKNWEAFIEVDLEPGTYRFFCGIISHAERGMTQVVTVA